MNNFVNKIFQKFNFIEGKQETVKTNCWSEKAINQFEKISSAELSLQFHYNCHAAKQHLYGSLEVITFTGKTVKMNEVLKNLDEAVDATNFEKGEFWERKLILVFVRLLIRPWNSRLLVDSKLKRLKNTKQSPNERNRENLWWLHQLLGEGYFSKSEIGHIWFLIQF